jgi:hypothetical protein
MVLNFESFSNFWELSFLRNVDSKNLENNNLCFIISRIITFEK